MKELIYRISYDIMFNIDIVPTWKIQSFNEYGFVVWVDDII